MLLFYNDWDKHPGAIINTNTKNTSFLRLAGIYKSMGIKNHAFMLGLLDKDLLDIDPFDPNLGREEITKITNESINNPWYYYREITRAPSIGGPTPISFIANRGNISSYWLHILHITTILTQIRQTGKTFSMATEDRYFLNVGTMNTKMLLITKDSKLRTDTIEMLKGIEKELPTYLQLTDKRKDTDNKEGVTVSRLSNRYIALLAQMSLVAARNVGRGQTVPILRTDETAYMVNAKHSIPVALKATVRAREIARDNGAPYFTSHTTTAGKLNTESGRYTYNMVVKSAKWTEKFYDAKDQEELEFLIRKNSPGGNLRVYIELNHRHLGKTDDWLREQIRENGGEEEGDTETDFLNIWLQSSGNSPIPKNLLRVLTESKRDVVYTEIREGYISRWYIKEDMLQYVQKNVSVVMGLDTSDAVGNDDIAMSIRDARTGALLAAGEYNETNLIMFADWLIGWFKLFKNFVLVVERRSSAIVIIDYLLKILPDIGIDPFKTIFNWVVDEKDEKPERFKDIDKPLYLRDKYMYVKYKKEFGYPTSGNGRSSRDNLYGTTLIKSIKYTGNAAHDDTLIKQVSSLKVKNGRLDHSSGDKDDLAISWLLSFWWLIHGKNSVYYNIDSTSILTRVKLDNVDSPDDENLEEKAEQERLKAEITKLMEELKANRNDIQQLKLTARIMKLSGRLSGKTIHTFNVHNMLESVLAERESLERKRQTIIY